MTEIDGTTYEYDVALSFAGEDREYVEEFAEQLKAEGIRVFYDSDYQTEMWGEELTEYLDQVYRIRARYAIIFISRFYADKMWPRHERRSALARALEQRSTYVLPVRLDSTPLDGLRPTIGYLDTRRLGMEGIVRAAMAKLTGTAPPPSSAITQTPRTEAERQQVLAERPPGWEYLYFAGQLLHERDNIEMKYRDHEIRYASLTGERVADTDIFAYLGQQANDARILAGKLSLLINDEAARERAFGKPGESGDPDRLAHLAKRINSVYEEYMDWAARMRGISTSSEFQRALELLARYADKPVERYRQFVADYVSQVDTLPAKIAAAEPVKIEVSLTLEIGDTIHQEFMAELDRIGNLSK